MTPKERAAMQQALDALESKLGETHPFAYDLEKAAAIRTLREALAEQAEQEQVAVLDITHGREPECYATPNADDLPEGTYRLYAAPVQPVDLTDEEVWKIYGITGLGKGMALRFARAVIAADREKNK